ncbi:MAG TPA: trypsin-like peptidase domain-containing protein [Vicinamibacterales bacterium]|nr:trypsin-like peptidase domain-containing protein [Vicinamibacterales bacterium]
MPRSVGTCRCGAALTNADPETAAVPAVADRRTSPVAVLALVAVVLIGAGYWLFMRPQAPQAAAATIPATADAPAATSDGAAGPPTSPEARAWDAAAKAAIVGPAVPATTDARPQPGPESPAATIEEMVQRVMPAVVLVQTTSGRGSGFYVRHDTVITNVHVVQNDGYVTLRKSDGSTASARVETRAPAFDIAVLKVAQPSVSQAVVPMGSAQSLKAGQEIVVIGSALGTLQNTVSRGIVSALRTSGGATLVQTDAATNPGNSGGPMLDRNGAVVGITTMGYRGAEGLNFGVAIEHARDLLEGRLVDLGTQSGLSNIQSAARGSESDRRLQQGEEQFRGGVEQLAQGAAHIDEGWRRFRAQCYTSPIAGNYNREWFVVMVPKALPANAAAGCVAYYQTLEGNIREFHNLMRRVIGDARRANVLPGTIRDALRANRLDFEWER